MIQQSNTGLHSPPSTIIDGHQLARLHRILSQSYSRVVLQVPDDMLALSFNIVQELRNVYPEKKFFVLYDCLKQSCCLDVIGAEHVAYDCLIHFGEACFSEPYLPNQYYLFDSLSHEHRKNLEILLSGKIVEYLHSRNIGYVMAEQKCYEEVKQIIVKSGGLSEQMELLLLPFDANDKSWQYLIFGYHIKRERTLKLNVLIVTVSECRDRQYPKLVEDMMFSLQSLKGFIGERLYLFTGEKKGEELITQVQKDDTRRLTQRYSFISQLNSKTTFGLIVSNAATAFHHRSLVRCKDLLSAAGKKHFVFMMNNLNEVKLGNFPEIEVYIVISCYNHSLFNLKDFHRVVVTPIDIEIAFGKRQFENYSFDLEQGVEKGNASVEKEKPPSKQHHDELLETETTMAVSSKIQTLDYYREREYKGLQFDDKKQIKKMTKGKIGLAENYSPLI